jgi:CRISPR system Cascade subunit CasA
VRGVSVMASFSVLRKPWIPVVDASGHSEELGLMDVLAQAHELVSITDPSPAVELGIYRILIALIIDAYDVHRYRQLVNLLRAGRFDIDALDQYVSSVGERRFDLFDPDYPFLQISEEAADGLSREPASRLLQHLPSGSFWLHFHHQRSDLQAFSPAVCARALSTVAPFMTAGGAGHSPSINGAPPWYVLVLGNNLFETLVLNCCVMIILGQEGDAPPAWRITEKITRVERGQVRDCKSICEGYTWRPRSVRFIPSQGGQCTYTGAQSDVLVQEMAYSFGAMFRGDWQDPAVAYFTNERGSFAIKPSAERELWRDVGPLALLRKEDYEKSKGKVRYSRPAIVDQYLQLQRDGYVGSSDRLEIAVYGMRTDQMKVFEWQCERLALPANVASNPRAASTTQYCIELAESVAYYLSRAFKACYPRQGKGNKRAFDTVIQRTQSEYWATLRPMFDQAVLGALAAGDPDDAEFVDSVLHRWADCSATQAASLFDRAADSLDSDSESMARTVKARRDLARSLWRMVASLDTAKKAVGGEAK